MKKKTAITVLGGDITRAAQAIGCTRDSIYKWDTDAYDNLKSKAAVDAVLAACVRLYHQGKLPDFDDATLMDLLQPHVGAGEPIAA